MIPSEKQSARFSAIIAHAFVWSGTHKAKALVRSEQLEVVFRFAFYIISFIDYHNLMLYNRVAFIILTSYFL